MFLQNWCVICTVITFYLIAETSADLEPYAGVALDGKAFAETSSKVVSSGCICKMFCQTDPTCTGAKWNTGGGAVDCKFTSADPILLLEEGLSRTFIKKQATMITPEETTTTTPETTTTIQSANTYYITAQASTFGNFPSILNSICAAERPSNGKLAVILTEVDRANVKTQLGKHTLELWTGLMWVNGIYTYHTGETITPPGSDIISSALKDNANIGTECMVMKDSSNFHARSCTSITGKKVLCMQ